MAWTSACARAPWRRAALALGLCASWLIAPAPATAQPDLRQMSGVPLPSGDLPDGAISVRVVRGAITNNVLGATVRLSGSGVDQTSTTDENGRAIFTGLPSGGTVTASVTVDGETASSQRIEVPSQGGVRVILGVGLAGSGSAPGAASTSDAPAKPGKVVLGTQSRTIIDINNERLEIVHIFEFVNMEPVPVSVEAPLAIDLPATALQATLLDGSTSQARLFDKRLVVAGPFAPGRTMAQVAYALPMEGGRREIAVTLPVETLATNVIVRRLGDVQLVSPVLTQSREATAEGRRYLTGTAPGVQAGATTTFIVEGLPHHPAWPRYTALGLAGVILVAGAWLAFIRPVNPAARIAALEARRSALLERLRALDGATSDADAGERAAILRELEGLYTLLDAERARA